LASASASASSAPEVESFADDDDDDDDDDDEVDGDMKTGLDYSIQSPLHMHSTTLSTSEWIIHVPTRNATTSWTKNTNEQNLSLSALL
jgi:hypothetical protein